VADVKVDAGTRAVLALEKGEEGHHENEEHDVGQNES